MDELTLGRNLSELRKKKAVSIRHLCRAAGISPASLSAIERGQSSPTLATLQKVLKALGTSYVEFFTNARVYEASPVFPRKTARIIEDRDREYTILYPKDSKLKFEILHEAVRASSAEGEWEIHDFDIGGVIIEGGPLFLEISGWGQWTVEEGDAFYIRAGLKHRATNRGKTILKMITVADPPHY